MSLRSMPLIALALVLSACSSENNSPAPAPEPSRLATVTIAAPGLVSDGDTKPLTATARDQFGAVITTATVTWSSSNTAVATISTAGVLTALREGQTELVASARVGDLSVEQRLPLTVALHPATVIELNSDEMDIPIGSQSATAITVRGADGRVLQNRPVTYTSDNPTVADVSATGVVRALKGGTARVIAAYGSLRDTMLIIVPTPVPNAASYRVTGVNGSATLPAVVDDEIVQTPDGQSHRYITRLDSATVSTGIGYTVALHLSLSERSELQGNVIERLIGRNTVRDEGTVYYDGPTNSAQLYSTKVGGLQHTLHLSRTPVELSFREPGNITPLLLRLAPRP